MKTCLTNHSRGFDRAVSLTLLLGAAGMIAGTGLLAQTQGPRDVRHFEWGDLSTAPSSAGINLTVSLYPTTGNQYRDAAEPKIFWVAIPPGSNVSIQTKNVAAKSVDPNTASLRVGYRQLTDSSSLVPVLAPLAGEGWKAPTDAAVVEGYDLYRGLRLARVRINPVITEGGLFKEVGSVDLGLTFTGRRAGSAHRRTDPYFEKTLESLVVNYDPATAVNEEASPAADTTGGWIDYGLSYLKLAIPADGIYRLSAADLSGAVPSLSGIDPATFRLFDRGIEIPMRVVDGADGQLNGQDFLEFPGIRNYGSPDYRTLPSGSQEYPLYLDRYTDTSFYWLTWGGSGGARIDTSFITGATQDTLRWFTKVVHLEQDKSLQFVGTSQLLHQDPAWLPGDVLCWGFLDVNQSFDGVFNAANVFTGGPQAALYARYSSWAASGGNPAHIVSLHLNGSGALETDSLGAFQHGLVQTQVSAAQVQNGSNLLQLRSLPTASTVNRLLVDWFDIEYPATLSASDSLDFEFRLLPSRDLRTIEISGLTSASVTIYKTSPGARRMIASTVSGAGPYTLTFVDTVGNGDRYFLADPAHMRRPAIVKSGSFVNLRSPQLGADYILITPRQFASLAAQYETVIGTTYDFRTITVFVEDIFDEFGYGYPRPESIRAFLEASTVYWQSPAPSFVMLAGDASYDFKNSTDVEPTRREKNLVPALGMPVSDPLLAVFGALPVPQMYIGRVPLSNATEFSEYLSRVQSYVSAGNDEWNKKYMFFAGGDPKSPGQIEAFKQVDEQIAGSYVLPAPIGGSPILFYKTTDPPSDLGPYTRQQADALIGQGAMIINYIGHSGTQTWDNGIGDPAQLQNERGRYALLLDFGCSTGKFAEPSIKAFSELFTLGETGSAIGYIGNSALGFEDVARTLPPEFFKAVLSDTILAIGQAHLTAKIRRANASGGPGILSNKVMLLTNTLIGDPALRLPVPLKPNLSIHTEGIVPNSATPSDDEDSVDVEMVYRNTGSVPADTFAVRIRTTYSQEQTDSLFWLSVPLFEDTIQYRYTIRDRPGQHGVTVTLNPAQTLQEIEYSANEAAIQIVVSSNSLRIYSPRPEYETSTRELVLLNPQRSAGILGNQVILQVDTGSGFSSPLQFTQMVQGVRTRFDLAVLALDRSYPWRAMIANDPRPWVEGVASFASQPGFRWHPNDSTEWQLHGLSGTAYDSSGVHLAPRNVDLKATSSGYDEGRIGIIEIDGINVVGNTFDRGHHVAVLDSVDCSLIDVRTFDTFASQAIAESLRVYLESVPTGRIVIEVISDEGSANLTTQVKNAIKSLGSALIDSVGFRDSWAIIGRKGAAPGSVPESYVPRFSGRAIVDSTLTRPFLQGSVVSPLVGPAGSWGGVEIQQQIPPGTSLTVDLLGIRPDGIIDTLQTGVTGNSIALGSIPAKEHPFLRLAAHLSANGAGESPVLEDWQVSMIPPAELILGDQTIVVETDSLLEGEVLPVTVAVHNIGESAAESVAVALRIQGQTISTETTEFSSLAAGSSASHVFPVATSGLRGLTTFVAEVDPDRSVPEVYRTNNTYSFQVLIAADTVSPAFDLTFDGERILDGDHVAANPEILISINDNSPLPLVDPASVVLKLDNRQVTLGTDPDSLFTSSTGKEKARVVYRPNLARGDHILSIQVQDASGNFADTTARETRFKVETNAGILNAVNVPNPFASETAFTFQLTGSNQPDEGILRIYAVSGRLLYERILHPGEINLGFNRITWNGRDRDGDEVANGVYFYRISVRMGNKSTETIEKLAKLR